MYEALSAAGVDVYSFDSHGHGRSEGEPRGYVEKFDHYVADLLEYIQQCQKKYTDRGETCPPLIFLGHSMGALVSVLAVLRLGSENVGGLVLTGPALGVDMNPVLHFQKMFAPAIDKFLPKSKIVDAVRPKDMSRNSEAVQAYIDDPLIPKGKLIARTAIQVDRNFDIAKDRRGEITCPILMLHGTNDRCTSIKASRDFFRHVGSSKKRFLQLPGLYHEIFEEPEVDQFMPSIVGFVSSGGKEFVDIGGTEEDGLVDVAFKQ
jgi:acylglycerol lipase